MERLICYRCRQPWENGACGCADGCCVVWGDCREALPLLAKGAADALITDTPYGVMLGDVKNGQAREKNNGQGQATYSLFTDTQEYIKAVVAPAIRQSLALTRRGAIFTGNRNLWLYPPADEIGCWYMPNAVSVGRWGFITANAILYYGASPRAGRGDTASGFILPTMREDVAHPCPKPLAVMMALVEKATLPNETVLDPFLGSGTTAVACKMLGRRCIGIEISEEYVRIACRRLDATTPPLPLLAPEPPEQGALL